MPPSYLIDIFLSAWAWLILGMLYPSVVNLVKMLNANMDKQLFQAVFSMVVKPSLWLASPFVLVFLFLLWRFGCFLYYTHTLGAGGIGLLLIMGLAGIVLIWLKALLTLMMQGFFSQKDGNSAKNKPPKHRHDEYGTLSDERMA